MINESIQLNSDKYYGDGQLAFKIIISGTTANIQILKDGNYLSSVESLVKTTTASTTSDSEESEVESNG